MTTTLALPQWTANEPFTAAAAALRQTGDNLDSLYLHVPFCFHKCHYCDFYSIVDAPAPQSTGNHFPPNTPGQLLNTSQQPHTLNNDPTGQPDRQTAFTSRLIAELNHRVSQMPLRPTTIFVGGGTPTLLRTELWRTLLTHMRRLGVLERVEEFTVEANPETVTPELLEVLIEGGVNRMSIGAQSFDPALLKTLERWHDPASVPAAVRQARDAGIQNINLDLIFAIPGQTLDDLRADLHAALALDPQHISYYGLTYEPNTALTQRLNLGQVQPADEELEREMYEWLLARLSAEGFEHYEISNWARPGRRCEHNLVYWRNRNWLGLGPGAASHVAGRRWKNLPHLGKYLAQHPQPPTCDHEHLPLSRRIGEQLMLGLRLIEGIPWNWLRQTLPADDPRWPVIEQLLEMKLLTTANENLRLTRRGLFLADCVIEMLIWEVHNGEDYPSLSAG